MLERALTAERRAETLAQQLHASQMEQEAMLVAQEYQKTEQTQKQQVLEQELVRQRQRHATMQESVNCITRDRMRYMIGSKHCLSSLHRH